MLVCSVIETQKGMFRMRAPAFVCRQISDFFYVFLSHLMRLLFPTAIQFEALAMSLYECFWFYNDLDLTSRQAISERAQTKISYPCP